MTEVLNLLDMPTDILTKIGEYVKNTKIYEYTPQIDFEEYGINIDLDEWNEEIDVEGVNLDEDACMDKLHMIIDDYVSFTELDEIEKIVFKYGFTKAIKLYDDSYGFNTDDVKDDMFVRKLAYVIIRENITIEEQ